MQGTPPLLLVDIDGVLSVFGFDVARPPDGRWVSVEGVAHLLSVAVAERLARLASVFEPVWCSGWEEKANDHLPLALGLGPWPYLSFDAIPGTGSHWKLAAIDAFAGASRPLAWIDDAHGEATAVWAAARPGPTLLLRTEPATGLTEADTEELLVWVRELGA